MKALRNVNQVELTNIPKLGTLTLRAAFVNVREGWVKNASQLEELKELKGRVKGEKRPSSPAKAPSPARKLVTVEEQCPTPAPSPAPAPFPVKEKNDGNRWASVTRARGTRKEVSIGSANELMRLERGVEVIEVKSNSCNNELESLDLSRFVNLREFIVGDKSFEGVEEVDLIGLNRLERVVIGKNCFSHKKSENEDKDKDKDEDEDDNTHFYVKRCERLKELKIGSMSCFCYNVFEIEDDDSLEVIELGEMGELLSCPFMLSSLVMKSKYNEM